MNSVYIVWREWSDGYDCSKHMVGIFKTEPSAEDHCKDLNKLSEDENNQFNEVEYWVEEVGVEE